MRGLLPIVLFLLPLSGTAEQEEWLAQTMAAVAKARATVLDYREEKTLSILQHSLISTGRLAYLPPDILIREIDGDPPVRYLVSKATIRVEEGGVPVREIRLDQQPQLAALMSGLRAILTGDLGLLRDHYRLEPSGEPTAWSLSLVPRDPELRPYLEGIRVTGHRGRIVTIEVKERGGDHSRMEFRPAHG